MSINTEILAKIAAPHPHRKHATEEHIFADNQKARTTAALIAEVKAKEAKGDRG
ncbi:hypothetical protein N8D56_21370 [Devosia sp. A8/3-2]|nr:hypothetical protein N8D56_21370 [Devosia sp. A8/3-2]